MAQLKATQTGYSLSEKTWSVAANVVWLENKSTAISRCIFDVLQQKSKSTA